MYKIYFIYYFVCNILSYTYMYIIKLFSIKIILNLKIIVTKETYQLLENNGK